MGGLSSKPERKESDAPPSSEEHTLRPANKKASRKINIRKNSEKAPVITWAMLQRHGTNIPSHNLSQQCQQIRSEDVFGHEESASYNEHDFAYFNLLQKKLRQDNIAPIKFHYPEDSRVIEYRNTERVIERTCLWTGRELLILSRTQHGNGTWSMFRRCTSVPETPDTPLHFYAILQPAYDSDCDDVAMQYETASAHCQLLYPYMKPEKFQFQEVKFEQNNTYTPISGIFLPALKTHFSGSWQNVRQLLGTQGTLKEEAFLAVVGTFFCILKLESLNLTHRDLSLANVLALPHGAMCLLIDLGSMTELNQQGIASSEHPLSTYPDPSQEKCTHDKHSDLYSAAADILIWHATDRTSTQDTIQKAIHKICTTEYRASTNYKKKRDNYKSLYNNLIIRAPVRTIYESLQPYLIGYMHPDPSERPSISDLFSDPGISRQIVECACIVARTYPDDFANIPTLNQHLQEIVNFDHFNNPMTKSLMSLLIVALHCKQLKHATQQHHKISMENLHQETTTHSPYLNIVEYYETRFPGEITTIRIFINSLVSEIIDETTMDAIQEAIQETIEYETIHRLCEEVTIHSECEDAIDDLCEKVAIRIECEKAIDDLCQEITIRFECEDVIDTIFLHVIADAEYKATIEATCQQVAVDAIDDICQEVADQTLSTIRTNRVIVILLLLTPAVISSAILMTTILNNTPPITATDTPTFNQYGLPALTACLLSSGFFLLRNIRNYLTSLGNNKRSIFYNPRISKSHLRAHPSNTKNNFINCNQMS